MKKAFIKGILYLLPFIPLGGCVNNSASTPGHVDEITVVSKNTIIDLDDSNFDDAVQSGLVLVKFWAPWCRPCMVLSPIFEDAAAKYPNIKFAAVNIDESKDIPQKYDIQVIPGIVALLDGQVVEISGGLSASELDAWIANLQNKGAKKDTATVIGTVIEHDVEDSVPGSKYFNTRGHRFVIDADGVRYWIRLTEEEYKKFPYLKKDSTIVINYQGRIVTPQEWEEQVGKQLDKNELVGPVVNPRIVTNFKMK